MANKLTICMNLTSKQDISIIESKYILESFLSIISHHSKTKKVKISNFGTFSSSITKKRIGRNPKTKESYIIEPVKKIKFNVSNKIREVLN